MRRSASNKKSSRDKDSDPQTEKLEILSEVELLPAQSQDRTAPSEPTSKEITKTRRAQRKKKR